MRNSVAWFDQAGASGSLVHIERFIDQNVFHTHEGGYGIVMRLQGVDAECLSEESLGACSAELLQGMRLLPENISLFQTFIKQRGGDLRPSRFIKESPDPVVRETEEARYQFLSTRQFFGISLFWTIYVHPPKSKKKAGTEQFGRNSERMLRTLRTAVSNLVAGMTRFGASVLNAQEAARLFAYMFNLDDSLFHGLRSPNNVNAQIAKTDPMWHGQGLTMRANTVHPRFVQPFSMIQPPAIPRPNLFGDLAKVPAEIVITLECRRKTTDDTRKEVRAHENFAEFFKHNVFVRMAHRKKEAPKSAAGVASDAALDITGLGGIIHDIANLGLTYCTFSLIGLVHSASVDGLRDDMAAINRVFGRSEAVLLEEGLGALSASQAMFPGAVSEMGMSLNVRRMWIREDYLSHLAFGYAPYCGEPYSSTLEDESLAVFETRAGTPYHFDQFASGPRGGLVIAEPRRGKTFFLNFMIDHEAKYGGYVFVFDIGGAYEHTVLKHEGTVVKVGLNGPRFNPFSLEDSPENMNEAARLVMMLLQRSGATLRPQDESDIRRSVAAIYGLENPALRRLKYLILSPDLQPYLAKWIEGGIYSALFDNAQDDLCLSRMISFDFEGLNRRDQEVLMQPLLFWIRLRIGSLMRAEGNMALPKLEIYDEVWKLIQDPDMLAGIFDSMKTGGKKLGGIMLATQDVKDLGPHAGVIRNACPDAFFLGGAFDRSQLEELFGLNATQLDTIPTLHRGEILVTRSNHSKIFRLVVDEESKWLYSTHPQDVRKRVEAIKLHGREKAFSLLAATQAAK